MRTFLGALSVATVATVVAGQQPAPAPTTTTVLIDAFAADHGGRPVVNLRSTDFELREDGRIVPIEDVRLIQVDPRQPADAPAPVVSRSDERRESQRSDTRLIGIFVDEYHLSPEALDRVRSALDVLLDRELGTRDLVVLMKPLDSLLSIRLTHDRDRARQIVAGLAARKGDYTARTDYERETWAGLPSSIEASRTQVVVSALNAMALHMGSLGDGRKTLIAVTEGFVPEPARRGQEYLATVDTVIRSANRGRVSIYAVDPRSSLPGAELDAPARVVMKRLVDETNGQLLGGPGMWWGSLARGINDATSYYLLTYRSAYGEDGAFHPVEVRVKSPGVTVRARSGYWASTAADRARQELLARASAPPPPLKLEPARRVSPLIEPWFGVSRGDGRQMRVSFVWEPTGRATPARPPRLPGRLVLTALAGDDSVLFEGPVLPTGAGVTQEPNGAPIRAVFEAPPGRLRIRMRIEDAASQPLDSDVRDIPVRDLRDGLAIGTPEIMRARNAREFRGLDANPAAIPVSSRGFSRTEHLLIRFTAYAPGGQVPAVAVRLLNRGGQVMRTLDVRLGPGDEHQSDLLLAPFAAGEYRLELTAESGGRQAKEVVTFRVTN